MNFKSLITLTIIFCTLYTFYFIFSDDPQINNEKSSQAVEKNNRKSILIPKEVTTVEDKNVAPKVKELPKPVPTKLPLMYTPTNSTNQIEEEKVINIGEFIDVDAPPIQSDEPEEVINIGEFIDVDAEPIQSNEPEEVINIGEFIDVDQR